MSSEHSGLLKSRAESFARHLQTRLRSLSESQGEPWAESADSEVYYDIDSSLTSPQEEEAEPLFIAAQNRDDMPLQRSDSEASTYFDSLESVEDLKTISPITARNAHSGSCLSENGVAPTVKNGYEHFLENNTTIDQNTISSLLKMKHDPFIGNIKNFNDAENSGIFKSLQLEEEVREKETRAMNTCDASASEENNNLGNEFEEATNFRFGLVNNNFDDVVVELDIRQPEEGYLVEDDIDSKDYCVYCDIEQKKSSISSDCSELSETSRTTCDSPCQELSGVLEEGTYSSLNATNDDDDACEDYDCDNNQKAFSHKIPKICIDSNTSDCSSSNGNIHLSHLLQELKLEITKENETENETKQCEAIDQLQSEDCSKNASETLTIESNSKQSEDEEFDVDTKRKYFQRSSSLKTGKTPPGTPGRKKIVRFADVLGLDLADVKTFLDEVPTVPKSAYEDLHGIDFAAELATECPRNTITVVIPQVERILTPLFQQPCIQPGFLDRVRQHNVCLENAIVSDMALSAISGLVRVKNMDFHKSVHVRYTVNNWHSFSDLQARYIPHSCDGFSDKFSFVLYAHTLAVGQKIEFAVRFQAAGAQYWDNNGGLNYVFVCNSMLPSGATVLPSGDLPLPLPLPPTSDDASAAFY